MLEYIKIALRIKTDAFDAELTSLINSAIADLKIAGITPETLESAPDIVKTAVATYCKLHFGTPADAERLNRAYEAQKAQLAYATGYTDYES